ncbi:peptide transporter [Gonapodya prolifera JEL478]|uniref:Peptide transporter n=1 Tax=Gonapodya prolifera (strain JEL478) TaxID=1344416 RepID=A0A139A192_GONPJ|nr:peptide transporter [Gonapodya prolifera JEL478]|eukprot:KXS10541.1 peptide transporter [Gonapodya prolifera JEL478]
MVDATAEEAKVLDPTIANDAPSPEADNENGAKDEKGGDFIDEDDTIITAADVANRLLSLRDDFDESITFRSMFLATVLAAFQAVMTMIYYFKPTTVTIQGTFIVLIAYFLGNAWATLLPRGDIHEAQWRAKGGEGPLPWRIRIIKFLNPGPWSLKEHAICSITASSASNSVESVVVFSAQNLFYDLPLSATTVVLGVISIGLFGYGLCGLLRPVAVWHVEAVYWGTLPTVKTLQGLHWEQMKNSKPLRWFWYSFAFMFMYQWFPAYIIPWLNSVSIPCLAAMYAVGSKADVLRNLFGGATNNEGLGLFSFSFDWQYITSYQTSLPLKLQWHQAIGFVVCYIAMLGIYYGNGWQALSQPFMSTRLRTADGSPYPVADIFVGGVLDEAALAQNGIPHLTGSFAYAMFMANAAIGALIAHCLLFWGGDIVRAYRSASDGSADRHHEHMAKHYKETPNSWYIATLVISFVLGLVVVLRENITLPAWAYIVSLILGIIIAPLSTLLYSRFGNGIATNNLSKMIAGLLLPGRPVGNMYFAAWSHNVIANTVNLCNDLKLGEYLKIPPRSMFLTQVYGTVLGGFINYVVMISIVNSNRDLLVNSDGDSSWSGATLQSYNTNAASWALAQYLYKAGTMYEMVPLGLAIGAGLVAIHRIITHFVPKIGSFSMDEINLPQFIQYSGYFPYNQSQTCIIFSTVISGFFTQFYLRNYRPKIFKDYMYLVTGALDGASLTVLFILSFAVLGAAGPAIPFPTWWGNYVDGNLDHCP